MQSYYQTDQITLYHGNYKDVLPTLEDKSVSLVLTDPPFGINYQNNYTLRKKNYIQGDDEHFDYTLLGKESFRILRYDTAFYAFSHWNHYFLNFIEIMSAGFSLKEPLICQKRASGTHDMYGAFQTNSDWVLFAHKGRFKFRETQLVTNKKGGIAIGRNRDKTPLYKTRMPSCWFGEKYPYSSENPLFGRQHGIDHPLIKSIDFCKWIILISSDEDSIVLDPFAGSGSMLVAALVTNRKAVGVEIEERYCETIVNRLEKWKKAREPSLSE